MRSMRTLCFGSIGGFIIVFGVLFSLVGFLLLFVLIFLQIAVGIAVFLCLLFGRVRWGGCFVRGTVGGSLCLGGGGLCRRRRRAFGLSLFFGLFGSSFGGLGLTQSVDEVTLGAAGRRRRPQAVIVLQVCGDLQTAGANARSIDHPCKGPALYF